MAECKSQINFPEVSLLATVVTVGQKQPAMRLWVERNYGPFEPNSIAYALNNNSGDIFDGYAIPAMADVGLKIIAPKMSMQTRRLISSNLGISGIMLAETKSIQEHIVRVITGSEGDLSWIMGMPDPNDRPAGLLGVVCYLGMSFFFNKTSKMTSEMLNEASAVKS